MTCSGVRETTICPSAQPSRFLSYSVFQICLVQVVVTLELYSLVVPSGSGLVSCRFFGCQQDGFCYGALRSFLKSYLSHALN